MIPVLNEATEKTPFIRKRYSPSRKLRRVYLFCRIINASRKVGESR